MHETIPPIAIVSVTVGELHPALAIGMQLCTDISSIDVLVAEENGSVVRSFQLNLRAVAEIVSASRWARSLPIPIKIHSARMIFAFASGFVVFHVAVESRSI